MFARHAFRIPGAADRSVVTDHRAAIEVVDAGVHQHHAVLATGLDERFEHMLVILANYIPNGAGGDEQFIGEDAGAAVDAGKEVLRDDALKRVGKLQDDLSLRAAFKNADDPFERMSDIGRMHRGQDEMAGFGGSERGGNCFVIAHFTHDDNIGILAKDMN